MNFEGKLTKRQREFIGTVFNTSKGGVLTVMGVGSKNNHGDVLFILECSICSNDKELWPYGSIVSVKGSLMGGYCPCGCAGSPKWSKSQYEVLIHRKCIEKNYIFQGFVGEHITNKTYLKLCNPINGNIWSTTSINHFLNRSTGCPLEGVTNKCTSQSDREQQINRTFRVEGGSFVNWCGEYKNAYSKFNWICNEGHDCCTSIAAFVYHNHRCMMCRVIKQRENGAIFGYYPDKINETDYLYIIHFKKGNCIKVGRSFEIDRRIKELLKSSDHTLAEIEVLSLFTGVHQEIYNTEQWIHEELTERGYYHNESEWSTETFTVDCKDTLFYLLNKTTLINVTSKDKDNGLDFIDF